MPPDDKLPSPRCKTVDRLACAAISTFELVAVCPICIVPVVVVGFIASVNIPLENVSVAVAVSATVFF
jgi:hypothetical protein